MNAEAMTTNRVRLVADDFGLHEAINRGIVDLARSKRLDAVSVMFHREACLAELDQLIATGVEIGCHLVLVEEHPLHPCSPSPMPSSYRQLFYTALKGGHALDWLLPEANCQMERARQMDLPLSFINSHQHVHLFPPLWRRLYPLFQQAGLPVRGARQTRAGPMKQFLVELSSSACMGRLTNPILDLIHPLGIADAGSATLRTAAEAARRARALPESTRAELIIHPGYCCDDLLSRYGHWKYQWQGEWELADTGKLHEMLSFPGSASD